MPEADPLPSAGPLSDGLPCTPKPAFVGGFRRGSERRSIAGQEVHCSGGLEFDLDLKRPVAGLMDLHLDPYRDINLPDESFSS